ncbi:IclR family transcriptional regulator [Nocardia cyriacigeorgica]|uniref:IclR family transcriptional regulator n=1 Tax=Nocardia cyriacigeorgica TaxID=135487 RepID=UPI0018962C39|nr:IclR family transcriptional regulator C-terminal domain-containing protein [Nocardia cyriacigeorgica]MBF6454614.1 helix-turn-helix domain-containing protein [Nocardia cyriacigeorgica]MBF6481242.1 helix-turn-helix domain-containing protein [Nocardia cyriacigeorgica]MBF6552508.1 helix-turn-helix domain-containing protein [Nocardia cyriacigeorgica]
MSPLRDPSRHHPSTVSNSLRILEVVATLGLGVTAKEIAAALHMPAATAYRLLNALVAEEYLVRTSDLRGFGLGARLDGLITAAARPIMPFAARSAIEELRSSVRFGVHVMGFRAGAVHVIDADPDHPVRAERELVRYPHASAAGKVLLAHDPEALDALPSRLPRLTPATVTDHAALRAQLEAVRRDGVATQIDELEPALSCAALPIRDAEGVVRGALCLAGTSARAQVIQAQVDAAARCAKSLGPLLY